MSKRKMYFIYDKFKVTKLSKLKIGDVFKKVGGKSVLIYSGKIRSYDRWGTYKGWAFSYYHWDDINTYAETRRDINVEVGFDF